MTIQSMSRALTQRLGGLIREMTPPVLFFFVALLMILLVFKLLVAQYTIEFYAFSKAALGAVIIGKAVLVMQWAEGEHRVRRLPLAAVVAIRTMIYAVGVIVFWLLERLIDASRHSGSAKAGFAILASNANLDRFLGLVILTSVVIGAYLALEEISRAMGPGALRKLFLTRPQSLPARTQLADAQ
jgi:hypothetical protein